MTKRLTRIYTRSGDDGTTGLADGSRLPKDSPRVAALGTVDELNSQLGVVLALDLPDELTGLLQSIQHRLFDLGGELALPGATVIDDTLIGALEQTIDRLNARLPPLREFVLPGGNLPAAHCHLARTVCRRAERALLRLSRQEAVNSASLRYLNRLSDLLFVLARLLARQNGGAEVLWQPGEPET